MSQLIDRFGRKHSYLRIAVTDKCNLRCAYCIPQHGIAWKKNDELLDDNEIIRLASIFVKLGINKIRITGGEPLVREKLIDLIAQLKLIDGIDTLAMTTNGVLLVKQMKALRASGLSALNISLDTFCREKFLKLTQRDDLPAVLMGIDSALSANFPILKLNAVVIAGINDDEILDFANFAYNNLINVRFIEYMPFKENGWRMDKVVDFKKIKAEIENKFKLQPLDIVPGSVAKDYTIDGGLGKISFITSMSDSFCSTCNRLRLTADGSIKSCLFSPGEINLRDALRQGITNSDIEHMILYALYLKPEVHPPAEQILASENRAMIEIGG